jgi:Protein of unknown function (DUF4235)
MASGSKAYTVVGLASTFAATIAVRKALTIAWRVSTGKTPPSDPAHPDVSLAEAVIWAGTTGVAVALARMLAMRKSADYYRRTTGHLPPGLEDVTA